MTFRPFIVSGADRVRRPTRLVLPLLLVSSFLTSASCSVIDGAFSVIKGTFSVARTGYRVAKKNGQRHNLGGERGV